MNTITKKIVFTLALIFTLNSLWAQNEITKIRGKVTDNQTGEVLPFVNVLLTGTTIGGITNLDGEYFIETRKPSDSISVSYLGYNRIAVPIQKGKYQEINFSLIATENQIEEVVVKPGENPAHRIFKKVIENKKQNDPYKYPAYYCETYNKIEFDINNVDDSFKDKRGFKQFEFVFDYVDTSAVTGTVFLPVFISETLSDVYYQKDPFKKKEIIKANRISGVSNESISQFTGEMYLDNNIYQNFITVFGREFVSPFADFGLLTYKYFLMEDSTFIDNKWCYHIMFKPRRKQEMTFTGDFWVNDTTFAIKKVTARIAEDANINYINDVIVTLEYNQIEEKAWFLSRDEVYIDFNLDIGDQSSPFIGRKLTTYKDVTLNPVLDKDFYADMVPEETVLLDDAFKNDTAFWNNARHEKLTQREREIYQMVDSIKGVRLFNTMIDYINMFFTGYYVAGNIELGPYYTFFSFNEIEGSRIKIGARTSNDFSTKTMYYGHLAYGFKDEKFKYGLGYMYMFSKNPRMSAGVSFSHDVEQLGQSQNAFMEDNIMSSMLKRNPIYKLSLVDESKGYFEKEWFNGLSNTLTLTHRRVYASDSIRFVEVESQNPHERIISSEIKLNTHFAFNEKFMYGEFERISVGTDYPIFNLDLTVGLPNVLGSKYQYFISVLNVSHWFNVSPFGYFQYRIEAGKIFGEVPYPLLRLHEGNETYAFDDFAFNMMNYYEFASDMYASVYAEQHFNGFFLNKVPLFRKLKLREVVYMKGVIGSLSDTNNPKFNPNSWEFPSVMMTEFNKPYVEGGVGVENIFKLLRIDAVWRFSYLDNPNIQVFGIRAKLQLIF